MTLNDTIVALATPSGSGAIAIIRVSGKNAISIASGVFKSVSNKSLLNQKSHTVHLGYIVNDNTIIDQVLATVFKTPHSYTGENVVEFSCHGSNYIQQEIIQLLIKKGCRVAKPGEFTLQAFLNGKMDLSQAEAVADLIASNSKASHQLALQQMRGGFATKIKTLRQNLLDFASLIELELDFTEEDVEFADKNQFQELITEIKETVKFLIDSFATGNVLKNGVPVAIIGRPNAGKSTLLNTLLNEERAIVSTVAGTTRDTIEDEITIKGIRFRFIDTAGLRETTDEIEQIGVTKALEKLKQSAIYIYLFDASSITPQEVKEDIETLAHNFKQIVVANKIDLLPQERLNAFSKAGITFIKLSAKNKTGLTELITRLLEKSEAERLQSNEFLITNSRHYESLQNTLSAISQIQTGIDTNLSGDLLAIDIREALFYLGEITGEVTNDELLGNIFANFCIGK